MKRSATNKKETKAIISTKKRSIFFLNILLIIIVLLFGFSIFSPKVSSIFYSYKREYLWNDFLSNLKHSKHLDTKRYWEFREFYSPGTFEFNKDGIKGADVSDSSIKKLLQLVNKEDRAFLIYGSKRLKSIDILSSNKKINAYLEKLPEFKNEEKITGDNFILIRQNTRATLLFIADFDEMKKTNGFFDYVEDDKDLVMGKYWVNISEIDIN